ncbi:chitinase 2-like [Lycium barbarum]|uniref:chitinase 2-like n=1 Tax=Lycium barbarum TaxID=112863 RepID=UPI00293ED9CE|nr:chitinase 2-like [Lycium barbarum]
MGADCRQALRALLADGHFRHNRLVGSVTSNRWGDIGIGILVAWCDRDHGVVHDTGAMGCDQGVIGHGVSSIISTAANSKLFREYIGAESTSVKLTDVPINSNIEFHFILAFAIDYNSDNSNPTPTNGKFNIFWENNHLNPTEIASIKSRYKNVKIAVSLGGDTVGDNKNVYFKPKSINSWVDNAISSLSPMIKEYNIDGIDIDYEHFLDTDINVFAECIGQLVTKLKKNGKIQFDSIAPYENSTIQSHYKTLWRKYGQLVSEHRDHIISALLSVSAECLSRQKAMFLMPIKSANQMPLTERRLFVVSLP